MSPSVPSDEHSGALPLERFCADARALDVPVFAARHGPAFFVLTESALRRPSGPSPTLLGAAADVGNTASVSFLVFRLMKRATSEFPFLSIGRNHNNDVWIDDVSVSKFHAYLKVDDGRWLLQDGRSRNGTTVRGQRVAARGAGPPTELPLRADIAFGQVRVSFLDAAAFKAFAADFVGP